MLGGTYVDSKVKGHFITPDPYGLLTDIHGEQFPNTPTWQFVGDAEYDYPLAGGTRLFLGGGFRYRSSSYAAFGRAPQFLLRAYGVADARAGVEFNDGRIRAFVWGKNIFNKRYLTSVNRPIDTTAVLTGMPATFGITVGYHY